jgi:NADH:ubiquinone oxidoreductase subunit E
MFDANKIAELNKLIEDYQFELAAVKELLKQAQQGAQALDEIVLKSIAKAISLAEKSKS